MNVERHVRSETQAALGSPGPNLRKSPISLRRKPSRSDGLYAFCLQRRNGRRRRKKVQEGPASLRFLGCDAYATREDDVALQLTWEPPDEFGSGNPEYYGDSVYYDFRLACCDCFLHRY